MSDQPPAEDATPGRTLMDAFKDAVREERAARLPRRTDSYYLPTELYWLVQDAARLQAMSEIADGLWERSFGDVDTEGGKEIRELIQAIDKMRRKVERAIRERYSGAQ